MEPYLFSRMAESEQTHWWFVGRRKIVEWAIKKMQLSDSATILEAGCGTGGNLELLGRFGQVMAMESDPNALSIASSKPGITVLNGSLPDQIPFGDTKFELIVLLDVIEHIEDDRAVLQMIRERLKNNGQLLLTVPAFPFLWSRHDELHHHYRRYTKNGLTTLLEQTGFIISFASYFNTFLFPVVATVRFFKRRLNQNNSDDIHNLPPIINSLLTLLLSSEKLFMHRMALPFGSSLLITAKLAPDYIPTK